MAYPPRLPLEEKGKDSPDRQTKQTVRKEGGEKVREEQKKISRHRIERTEAKLDLGEIR